MLGSRASWDVRYREIGKTALDFLIEGIYKDSIYDRHMGECYDGVDPKAVNLNQVTESTICYLLAPLAFDKT